MTKPEDLVDVTTPEKIATVCKFCKRPLELIVEKSYLAMGDPHKLLPMASCDNCYEFRIKRRHIVDAFWKIVPLLDRGLVRRREDIQAVREKIDWLLRRYVRAFAEYQHTTEPAFDEAMVDSVMGCPTRFQDVMARVPSIFAK